MEFNRTESVNVSHAEKEAGEMAINELNELQLMLVGGGIADTMPH